MAQFSRRTPRDQHPNRLAAARQRLGAPDYDLTESNPTQCGLIGPEDILSPLANPAGLGYDPNPRGPLSTRRAIASSYLRWNVAVEPDRVFLTTSTSEAYGFLFKLLADPGNHVLVPSPSYPLFEQLARLEALELVAYELAADDDWRIDRAAISSAPDGCRVAIVVHPNNPTGSFVHPDDAAYLAGICRDRGWALVADEVFFPYPLDPGNAARRTFAGPSPCLTCTLGGLSKSAGLPQIKLAWIVLSGPDDEVADAAARLDYITDAYLSVSTPSALAAPELMVRGGAIHEAILARCRANLDALLSLVSQTPAVTLTAPQGGWSAILRVPVVIDGEELALRLLEEHGVAVHPGFLFDLPSEGHLVLSLLPREEVFAEGVRRLLSFVSEIVAD